MRPGLVARAVLGLGAFVAAGHGLAGGPGFDPETYPGNYSSFHRHEERILTALHRHALATKAD